MGLIRGKPGTKVDGAKLTEARLAAGLSLLDVARKLGDGCNKSSVSRWEQGLLNPSPERIEKLAKMYGRRGFINRGKGK
jgi:transcriptional regulator with XRE-family HTH domain